MANSGKRTHELIQIRDYIDMQYEIRKNALTQEVEIKKRKDKQFELLDEAYMNSIWFDLQIDGFKCTDATLMKLLNSRLTEAYNPLAMFIENLPVYDEKDYIQELADTVEVSNINSDSVKLAELWKPFLQKWLVASVATALGRGVNHTCLILVGGQGLGKTTWLNKLCPTDMKEFLICSHINPSLTDVNTANFLAEKWFVNIDDQLETIFGKDFNSMKAIITAPFVTNRKTWHRFSRKRQRVCSFMGSVNNAQFLTDSENRRYLVFSVDDVDFMKDIDMKMVWSQALHLLNNGYQYWFSYEEMKQLNTMNEYYRQPTSEEEWLIKVFEPMEEKSLGSDLMMSSEILTRLIYYSNLKLSSKRLATALRKAGFGEPLARKIDGVSRRVYPVKERKVEPRQ